MTETKTEKDNAEHIVPVFVTSWTKVLYQIHLHLCALYGLSLVFTQASIFTTLLCVSLIYLGVVGITIGGHRLWAHRCYEAVWPLRAFLAACYTLNCKGSIMDWAITHRVHHRFFGTPVDPFNHKKGLLFAHVGANCLEYNADIERFKRLSDNSDLEDDSVVYYQHWLYWLLMPVFSVFVPIYTATHLWGESLPVAIFIVGFLRVVFLTHLSWFVQSGYLFWGLDPNDRKSGETWLIFFITKSLWPQYHYVLPWDYKTGEYGTYNTGFCTSILRVFAALGLINKLTTISSTGVRQALAKSVKSGIPLTECLNSEKMVVKDIVDPYSDN